MNLYIINKVGEIEEEIGIEFELEEGGGAIDILLAFIAESSNSVEGEAVH